MEFGMAAHSFQCLVKVLRAVRVAASAEEKSTVLEGLHTGERRHIDDRHAGRKAQRMYGRLNPEIDFEGRPMTRD